MENFSFQSEKEKVLNATKKLYTKLIRGLRCLTGNNGWGVLLDMEYVDYEKCTKPSNFQHLGNICPYNIVNRDGEDYFQCVCGKPHIHNLAIMKYKCKEWDYMILGSDCIEGTLKFIKEVEGIDNLKDKMSVWCKDIEKGKRKITHKQCVSCKKYRVNRKTNYKNPARNYWCNDCCGGSCVNCIQCGKDRVFQYDYKGTPMLYCRDCYFSQVPLLSSSYNT